MASNGNVTFTSVSLRIPDAGDANPLPPVQAALAQPYRIGTGVPAQLREATEYGRVANIYPYSVQSGYSRELHTRDVPAVVLENKYLRAVVLPTLGGRLWELFHKPSGKHLLHTGDTVQFANLALRNCWFAGGIEWNIGTRGHSPSTCQTLHTAIVELPDGRNVLRMWEFERLREVVFQVELWLPEDSEVLLSAVRIQNPNGHNVPMYWWSNAAVPQTASTRVIAPAVEAYGSDYSTDIKRVTPTKMDFGDATWPQNSPHAADYFFDIAPGRRHWITAVDHDGDGLAMLSTGRLRGKKLFVWGQGSGGQRWQEWLSPSGGQYAEIQAGLAQTQFEHLSLPAHSSWSWVEAFGNAALESVPAHSADWNQAVEHASARLETLMPSASMEAALAQAEAGFDTAPTHMLLRGNAWGALERERRAEASGGRAWVNESGTPFGDVDADDEAAPWLQLLRSSREVASPELDAHEPRFTGAASFVCGSDWEELLLAEGSAEAMFHVAIIRHARQELDTTVQINSAVQIHSAVQAYGAALELKELSRRSQALALRGRGVALLGLAAQDPEGAAAAERIAEGLAQLEAACTVEPENASLLVEAMTLSIRHLRPEVALALSERAPSDLSGTGRPKFLQALALARLGQAAKAAQILRDGVQIPDLREGEDAISELWEEVCPQVPVPAEYRFAMQ
ncbi:DUF5107 domain-containing protein [Pseudarthrobacter sp. J1763]|uniref:DUF5107 domain-containing protein n=1 Tax=Pseudarthrobacter sp. J1763 TaxID=3420445 RepID=UPI003D2BFBE8